MRQLDTDEVACHGHRRDDLALRLRDTPAFVCITGVPLTLKKKWTGETRLAKAAVRSVFAVQRRNDLAGSELCLVCQSLRQPRSQKVAVST